MMSLSQIREASRRASRKASREKKYPYIIEDHEDITNDVLRYIPFIGDWRPRGYKLIEEYFVDSSGFGSESEPALTISAFLRKLKPGHAYAIVEAGQFQVYVGEFEVNKNRR